MKGVILAGDTGSKLYPLTKVTNKHLLPVYDKPLIYYPIEAMVSAGIEEIMMILSGEMAGDCMRLLGSGKELGVTITYKFYDAGDGIVDKLLEAKDFVGDEQLMVIIGDNVVVGGDLLNSVEDFKSSKFDAGIFLKEVPYPERYGVAEVRDGKVKMIEERLLCPSSNYAITGIYLYKPQVFEIIERLRNEDSKLDAFGLNNYFINQDLLKAYYLKGYWIDVQRFESLFKAAMFVREEYRKKDL